MSRAVRLLAVAGLVLMALLIGGSASAAPSTCQIPPEPDRPASGLVGMLDPTPDGAGGAGSVYAEVGYAGMTWHTYDICARPDATSAGTDTWVGSTLFNAAKTIVAAANGLHYQLGDPADGSGSGDQLDGLDVLLHQGVRAMYTSVFTTWVGPALLVLALALFVLAARGDLARQAQRVGVAVAALAVAGTAYAAPLSLLRGADSILLDGVAQMQQGFLGELGVSDPDSLPDTLTDQIVYANWLRGEFGSVDAPQARDLGRGLLRAQTYTRAEVAAGQDTADVANRKKQEFAALTGKMGDRYPQFQGIAGSRVGTGGVALLQALALAAFPAAAKLIVFVSLIILRLLVLFSPLVAVIAIMRPQILISLFRLVAGVLTNAVLAGALAAAHAWLVVAMLAPDSGVAPMLTLIVAATVSALFWVLIRPVRRLMTLGSMVIPHVQQPLSAVALPGGDGAAAPPVRTLPGLSGRAPVLSRSLHLPQERDRPAIAAATLPTARPAGLDTTSRAGRADGAPSDRSTGEHPVSVIDPAPATVIDPALDAPLPAAGRAARRARAGGGARRYLG